MANVNDVLKAVDGKRDEIVRFMVDMLKIKAVNPDGGGQGEYERALFVKKWLENQGCVVQRHDVPDKRVPEGVRVSLTTILEGQDKNRTLWLAAHLDTVPEGSRELWSTDPYTPVVKDDKIFARGSEDNGQAVGSLMLTLKAIKELQAKPKLSVGFAFMADEESGSKYGAQPLVQENIFRPTDFVIVPDTGTPDGSQIEVAEKGMLWLKVATKGLQVHGSQPERGLNAHRVGMRFALEIDELLHRKYNATDQIFDPPNSTFEPTKHEANVDNINTVPGLDVQYFDCRILPQYPLPEVLGEIEAVKSRIEKETGAAIEITRMLYEESAKPTPLDSEVVRKLKAALKELRGVDGKPIGIGGGTVGLYFRRKGIQTAVWSTLDEMAHQPNEYCKIENMIADAKVFVHVAMS